MFAVLGPLAVLLTDKRRSHFAREHAVEALNFEVSMLAYALGVVVLAFISLGLMMTPAFLALLALVAHYVVASTLGARHAARGEPYRYPFTFRLLRAD
jgi:uncharacterized Tic20 family protein